MGLCFQCFLLFFAFLVVLSHLHQVRSFFLSPSTPINLITRGAVNFDLCVPSPFGHMITQNTHNYNYRGGLEINIYRQQKGNRQQRSFKMVNIEVLGIGSKGDKGKKSNFEAELSYFDTARIYVRAGSGGAGSKHFRSHSKASNNHQKTVPDGGSGGKGGDVILVCNRAINTLQNFRGKKSFSAENGHDGSGQYNTGRKGATEEIFVPPGTMVYLEEEIEDEEQINNELYNNYNTNNNNINNVASSQLESSGSNVNMDLIDFDILSEDSIIQQRQHQDQLGEKAEKVQEKIEKPKRRTKKTFLYELKEDGNRWTAALGGEGGIGNGAVKGNTGRACPPRGGEKRWLTLELRLVADVGLVAVPSAGKSTLLSKISNAKPKIAAYHFTTLVPNLGVCEKYVVSSYDSLSQSKMERSLIVADIPGLIEGAHRGLGLGKAFLKHVEKCRVIVHIVDGNTGVESALTNFDVINRELALFSKDLATKPQVVVVNKIDTLTEADLKIMKEGLLSKMSHTRLLAISAATGEGVNEMMQRLVSFIKKIDDHHDQNEILLSSSSSRSP